MKRYEDYTKEELNALTQEQVLKIIDIECAFEGKPFVPDIPDMPDVPVFKPDKVAYECAGYAFEQIEDAQKLYTTIIELNPKRKDTNYSSGQTTYTLKTDSYYAPKVEKIEIYSNEYLLQIKEQKKKSDEAMKRYNLELEEYKKIVDTRADISKMVWKGVNEAQNYFYVQNKRISEFKRYLNLSEGNVEIAWNFITAAYPKIEDDFENIKNICLAAIEEKTEGGNTVEN